jgi:hypothetical protein
LQVAEILPAISKTLMNKLDIKIYIASALFTEKDCSGEYTKCLLPNYNVNNHFCFKKTVAPAYFYFPFVF